MNKRKRKKEPIIKDINSAVYGLLRCFDDVCHRESEKRLREAREIIEND